MSAGVSAAPAALPEALSPQEQVAFRKIAWRLLPILVVAYLFNYLDRTNIGLAAITMNKDVGLTASQFGVGAGILFVGYCLFEIPSNLIQYRVGARRWISRIMITWGLASAAMALAVGPKSFYAYRFLLGVAEAGFFPGVTFYLSYWFPRRWRSSILTWFLVSIPGSSLLGGPLSGALLGLNGAFGISGWQWLFLAEGLPCVLVGVALLVMLVDRPEDARWLTPEERVLVTTRLAGETRERPIHRFSLVFGDARVWLLSGIYLCFLVGGYGIQVWMPLIIKQQNFSNFVVGLWTAVPYFFSVLAMILWSGWVDRHGGRVWHLVATCALGSAGFALALASGSFGPAMFGMTLALVGTNASRGLMWAIPTSFLVGEASAGGLALINSLGTMGGFFGPSIIGWLKDATGSFTAGLVAMAVFLAMSAVLAAVLRIFVREG